MKSLICAQQSLFQILDTVRFEVLWKSEVLLHQNSDIRTFVDKGVDFYQEISKFYQLDVIFSEKIGHHRDPIRELGSEAACGVVYDQGSAKINVLDRSEVLDMVASRSLKTVFPK